MYTLRSLVPAILYGGMVLSWLAAVSPACRAQDWPQFLGPHRDGVVRTSVPLVEDFPAAGPTVVWRVPGGIGMSGIVISGQHCLTIARRNDQQTLLALDRATGQLRWQAALAPAYENTMGPGARATPAIDEGRVFTFTGEGILSAHDLEQGTQLWSRNLVRDFNTKPAEYGMASSPLVSHGRVIAQVGADEAAVIAVDAKTGADAWRVGSGRAGYASPTLLDVAGVPQLVAFTAQGCWGIEPAEGTQLWFYAFPTDYDCNIATPLSIAGNILLSAGENRGSVLLKVAPRGSEFAITEVWSSLGPGSGLRSEWQTPLLLGQNLFGFDNVGSAGPVTNLACLDANTGEVLWKKMRFGKANAIAADGKLVITTMDGELVLVRATGEKFQELARAALLGKTRQAAALSGGFIFVRDDQEIICVDLRAK